MNRGKVVKAEAQVVEVAVAAGSVGQSPSVVPDGDNTCKEVVRGLFEFLCDGKMLIYSQEQIDEMLGSSGIAALMDRLTELLAENCMNCHELDVGLLSTRLQQLGLTQKTGIAFIFKIAEQIIEKCFAFFGEQRTIGAEAAVSDGESAPTHKHIKHFAWISVVFNAKKNLLDSLKESGMLMADRGYKLNVGFRKELERAITIIDSVNQQSLPGGQIEQGDLLCIYSDLTKSQFTLIVKSLCVDADISAKERALGVIVSQEAKTQHDHCSIDLQIVTIELLRQFYEKYFPKDFGLKLAGALVQFWNSQDLINICSNEGEDAAKLKVSIVKWCCEFSEERRSGMSHASPELSLQVLMIHTSLTFVPKSGTSSEYDDLCSAIYSVLDVGENKLAYLSRAIEEHEPPCGRTSAKALQLAAIISSDSDKFLPGPRLQKISGLLYGLDRGSEQLPHHSNAVRYPLTMLAVSRVFRYYRFMEMKRRRSKPADVMPLIPEFCSPNSQVKYSLISKSDLKKQIETYLDPSCLRNRGKKGSPWARLYFEAITLACDLFRSTTKELLSLADEDRKSLIVAKGRVVRDEVFSHLYLRLYFLECSHANPDPRKTSDFQVEYRPVLLSILRHVGHFYDAIAINNTLRGLTSFSYECIIQICTEEESRDKDYLLSVLSRADMATISQVGLHPPVGRIEILVKKVINRYSAPLWLEYFITMISPANPAEKISVLRKLFFAHSLSQNPAYMEAFDRCVCRILDMSATLQPDSDSAVLEIDIFKSLVLFYMQIVSASNEFSAKYYESWVKRSIENVATRCGVVAPFPCLSDAFQSLLELHFFVSTCNPPVSDAIAVDVRNWVSHFSGIVRLAQYEAPSKQEKIAFLIMALHHYLNFDDTEKTHLNDSFKGFLSSAFFKDLSFGGDGGGSNEHRSILNSVHSVNDQLLPKNMQPKSEAQKAAKRRKRANRKEKRKAARLIAEQEAAKMAEERREASETSMMLIEDSRSHIVRSEGAEKVPDADAAVLSVANCLARPKGFEKHRDAPLKLTIYDVRCKQFVVFGEGSELFADLASLVSTFQEQGIHVFAKFISPDVAGSDLDLLILLEGSLLTESVVGALAESCISCHSVDLFNTLNKFHYERGAVKIKIDIQTLGIKSGEPKSQALHKYFQERSMCFLETALLWGFAVKDGRLSVELPFSKVPEGLSSQEFDNRFDDFHANGALHMCELYRQNHLPGDRYIKNSDFRRHVPADFSTYIRNLFFVFKQLLKAKCPLESFRPYADMFSKLYRLGFRHVVMEINQSWPRFFEDSIAHKTAWLKHLRVLQSLNAEPGSKIDSNLTDFIDCSIELLLRIADSNVTPHTHLASWRMPEIIPELHAALHSRLLASCLKLEELLRSSSELSEFAPQLSPFMELYSDPQFADFTHRFYRNFIARRLGCSSEAEKTARKKKIDALCLLVIAKPEKTLLLSNFKAFLKLNRRICKESVMPASPVRCSPLSGPYHSSLYPAGARSDRLLRPEGRAYGNDATCPLGSCESRGANPS